MKKVLVTGAAGFLGSNLCSELLVRDYEVYGLDNLSTGFQRNIKKIESNKNFHFYLSDLSLGLPESLILNYDYIYHLASPASPPKYLKLALETITVNTMGTKILLDHVKDHGGRILFASTSEIYGDPEQHPQKETYWGNVNPIGPRSVYDESKRLGETIISLYLRNEWVDSVIVRIFNTYGPNLDPNDGRVISSFLRDGIDGKPLTVYGTGNQTRSFCYVDDLISGLLFAMESKFSGPINLGNPNEITIKTLIREIEQVLGKQLKVVFTDLPENDPKKKKTGYFTGNGRARVESKN